MAEQAQNTSSSTVSKPSDNQETELPISTSPSPPSQPTNSQHTLVHTSQEQQIRAEEAENTLPSSMSHAYDDQETDISTSQSPPFASQPTDTQVDMPTEQYEYESLNIRLLEGQDSSDENPLIISYNNARRRACLWVFLCSILITCIWAIFSGMYDFDKPLNLQVSPNWSYLIKVSPMSARTIEAEQKGDQKLGPMLYGFHKIPSLDVESTWSESHNASVHANSFMNWTYYLNDGSKISIAYDVISSPLILVILQGNNSLEKWKENPVIANDTLYWRSIQGRGNITQDIGSSDFYYIAVANLLSETTMVDLNFTMDSLLYNTSDAHFKCSVIDQVCSFKLLLMRPNAAVLTSPGVEQDAQVKDDYNWNITVSFGPQYLPPIIALCIMLIYSGACMIMIAKMVKALAEVEPLPGGNNQSGSSLSGSTTAEAGTEPSFDSNCMEGFLFSFDEVENDRPIVGCSCSSEPEVTTC